MNWPTIRQADRTSFLKIDIAGIAACLILSGTAYFIGAHPLLSIREQRAAQEQSLRDATEQANSLVGTTRGLRKQLARAQDALAQIEIPLQSASAINQRVAELTSLAGECRIEMQAIQPGSLSSTPRFGQIPIQIAASGTYRATADFLHRLRDRFPDTAVCAFELSATPDDAAAVVASFSVQLTWYVQPLASDAQKKLSDAR
jgi:hypothetical protein